MDYRNVVTSFIQSNQKLLLLRRSGKVGTNQGKWAAVSGYLERNETPFDRASTEVQEEVGLRLDQIKLVRSGVPLRAFDEENDIVWAVNPFLFTTRDPGVKLDWEHTEFKWVNPEELDSYDTVPKLKETFERVRWDLQTLHPSLLEPSEMMRRLAEDRVSGASSLGRQAVQIIAAAAKSSSAQLEDDLFRDMLLLFLKLRSVQPSMATLRNLAGKLLYFADSRRINSSSIDEFRNSVLDTARNIISESSRESEDASTNFVSILPRNARILSHSYSSTVRRALESANKQGKKPEVYVTESAPGHEGKRLAKDLNESGIRCCVIPDSETGTVMGDLDLVVVGADSVRADGSVINKIGTEKIAVEAKSKDVPLYAICETSKFSTANFLGEDVEITEIFDVTPSSMIQKIITEDKALEPSQVVDQIKIMLRELYT